MMTDNERALLDSVKQMEKDAPGVGLCSYPFKILYDEIEQLIKDRDSWKRLAEGDGEC